VHSSNGIEGTQLLLESISIQQYECFSCIYCAGCSADAWMRIRKTKQQIEAILH